MLELAFLVDGANERTFSSDAQVVRFGRSPDCELQLRGQVGARVQPRHGSFVLEDGAYVLLAPGEDCGVWVNGRRVMRLILRGGERIRVGSPRGPEIRVLKAQGPSPRVSSPVADDDEATVAMGPAEFRALQASAEPQKPSQASELNLEGALLDADVHPWLERVQRQLRRARAGTQGQSSGQTLVIMASALSGLQRRAEGQVRRGRRRLVALGMGSALLVSVLLGVIWFQHRALAQLEGEKDAIDAQIDAVFAAMATETDETKLGELEARLVALMGTAKEKVNEVSQRNEARAVALAQPADPLEADIRKILRSFNAETYAIPPVFKRELERHILALERDPTLHQAYARKLKLWPKIQETLRRHQLPEELGYIAFAESSFDPTAVNARSGASGMWQLMEEVARNCGIRVERERRLDERMDPLRSSEAAACYLSKLLIEFGEESFMLALASYNRGENGVRRALHKVALQPGGFKKRDFWHLYRLRLLPEETREYVPKVLAAAIVFGSPERYGLASTP